jgi:hypothetical protein
MRYFVGFFTKRGVPFIKSGFLALSGLAIF